MSDTQTDPRTPPEDDTGREAKAGSDAVVPAPVHDEVTVELVRDAIAVAHGNLADERFAEKYDTGDRPVRDRTQPAAADRLDR